MNEPVFVAPWSGWFSNQNDALPVLIRAPLETSAPDYAVLGFPIITSNHELVTAARLFAIDNVSGLPNAVQMDDATSALLVKEVVPGGTGASSVGSVGAASALVKAANANARWLTIQNTHLTATLYLSFTDPSTVNDIKLVAGASITFETAPMNDIYGIGSVAGTTFAIMEMS